MPTSKNFLPDVNVWLALVSQRHVHAGVCGEWLASMRSETVSFCRVTQMGLLRLLTNSSVMGNDVLSMRDSWRTYRTLLADERVRFAPEPAGLETEWHRMTSHDRSTPTPKVWTDAYLAAFADAAGMQLVTLDRAISSMAKKALVLR